MPSLRALLCNPDEQIIFLERGAAALYALTNAPMSPTLIGTRENKIKPPGETALKPCQLLEAPFPEVPAEWPRIAGYFHLTADHGCVPMVRLFAVLAILLLFPLAQKEVSLGSPANFAPFFFGGPMCVDITTRFERHLTGCGTTPAKLPAEIVIAELQLFRRLTPPGDV